MNRLWTIIGVRDVRRSFEWYRTLLGLRDAEPAHDHFAQLIDGDGSVLLSLHAWGAHEHPTLADRSLGEAGNGLILFFRVDDFDAALARARGNSLEEEPHTNPNTGTREFSLRDPDGYYVSISEL